MDLAGVDLVEERHHDERVEDDGEVLRRRRVQRYLATAVDVEYQVTCATRQPPTRLPDNTCVATIFRGWVRPAVDPRFLVREGTMEGLKAPSEVPREVGSEEGRRSPSTGWGLGRSPQIFFEI